MFILNWFKNLLYSLGLLKKNAKIIFLGLDNAGKTSILMRLKTDRITTSCATFHPYTEELVLGNIRFKALDIGGLEGAEKTWKEFLPNIDGIIYVIDAADRERFSKCKKILESLLTAPEFYKIPIVIFGNKNDKKDAVSEEELRFGIGLSSKSSWETEKINKIDEKPIEVFMCSVIKRRGYIEGLKWLSQFLK